MFIEISNVRNNQNIIIGNIYRPPKESVRHLNDFHDDFMETVHLLPQRSNEIILAGDFNIDLLKIRSKPRFENFFETMCTLNLLPKITNPTRISSNSCTLIDNIYCSVTKCFNDISAGVLSHRLSDHQPVFAVLSVSTVKLTKWSKERKINNTNMQAFKNDLIDNPIVLPDEDANFDDFHYSFQAKFENFFPITTIRNTKYNKNKSK